MGITPEDLQAKLAQIAQRYLDRVTREIVQLEALVDRGVAGDMDAVKEIEVLTHRMHGSGAMLHFDEISTPAGMLERASAEFIRTGIIDGPKLLPILQQLREAIQKACANRTPPQS